MKKKYPIGVDDFKEIIDTNMYLVDKTMFIKELIDASSKVTIIARPRRFGKTLNMSMLKYYFEKTKESHSYLFENLKISKQRPFYTNEQGKYPVIQLTLKDVKMNTWEKSYNNICDLIATEFIRHSDLLESQSLQWKDKRIFEEILNLKGNETIYAKSLELLSRVLYQHHKQKVIILIDEYDTLLNEAYINGYYEEVIAFMKVFLNAALRQGSPEEMLKALLKGDMETFHYIFQEIVQRSVSYNDVGRDTSENFYHAFVLGLLVSLDKDYDVRSNRESGFGGYDVMIIPKDINKKGIIIEFKKVNDFKNESLEKAVKAALDQIEDRQYEVELKARGITDILKLGIAFKGKEIDMKGI